MINKMIECNESFKHDTKELVREIMSGLNQLKEDLRLQMSTLARSTLPLTDRTHASQSRVSFATDTGNFIPPGHSTMVGGASTPQNSMVNSVTEQSVNSDIKSGNNNNDN